MRLSTILLAMTAVTIALAATPAMGQGFFRGTSDNPNGPTVSPYLNLLNNNPLSPVTSYQSLVKPLIDQNSAIQRQGAALQRQGGALQQLQQGGVMGTGRHSYFMYYSHYYPTAGPR